MKKPIHCKHCDSSLHYSYACSTQRKPVAIKTLPTRSKKPISRSGKQNKRWLRVRKQWIIEHPFPLHRCHYCGKSIGESEMTLDHKIPRSRAPELRYDFGNLVPACWTCNLMKGSLSHDEYMHECYS